MGKPLPGRVISSFSGDSGCVEVWWDDSENVVGVVDTAERGDMVTVSPDDWEKFVAGVKAGEFDLARLKAKGGEAVAASL